MKSTCLLHPMRRCEHQQCFAVTRLPCHYRHKEAATTRGQSDRTSGVIKAADSALGLRAVGNGAHIKLDTAYDKDVVGGRTSA
eukprot:6209912-Pleurochrysis_carterae.AAC.1